MDMWKIVVTFYYIQMSSGLSLIDDTTAKSLTEIVSKVLLEMPKCVVVVMSDPSLLQLPNDVVYLRADSNSSDLFSMLRASYTMKCTGYLVDENSAENFLTILGKARSTAPERHTPRVVFIPNQVGNYSRSVFSHPESSYIPDMIAIQIISSEKTSHVEVGEESVVKIAVITNNFQGNSGSKEGEVIGIWPTDDMVFFPDKLNDLKGKDLIVATFHYPPYVLLYPDFDGIEVRMMDEFCKRYNCRVSALYDDNMWGEIFKNGTGIGVSGDVYLDRADIGNGAFFIWEHEYHYIDYSYPYLNTKVTVLVPKPEKVAEWRIPFQPFSLTLWILQAVSIVVAALIMLAVNIASDHISEGLALGGEFATGGGIFLRAFAMALLQPPPQRLPSASPLRRFFTLFEVLFIFFTSIYSGALSSVLTVPIYYPPIDTCMQLYEAGIPWAADHTAWVFSIQGATEQPLKGIAERFEAYPTETLLSLAKTGGYGFSIEISAAGLVTQIKHLTEEMLLNYHIMKDELYASPLVVVFRKGSPYSEKLNKLIGKCVDAGLPLLWGTDVTLTYLSSRLQTALKISEGSKIDVHDPTQLNLVHIQGTLFFLSIGLFVSFVVFVLEKMEIIPPPSIYPKGIHKI